MPNTILRVNGFGAAQQRPEPFLFPVPAHRTIAISPVDEKADDSVDRNTHEPDMPPEALAVVARIDAQNAWAQALLRWRRARQDVRNAPSYKTNAELIAAARNLAAQRGGLFRVV